jgi:shikimate dehydrogenase
VPGRQPLLSSPRGTTRVCGVIGDPVAHSLSPVLHNSAFAALGLDWVYVAFPVPRGSGAAAVDAMRALGLAGLSVTMPHKADVVPRLDRLSPVAAELGVVNTISWARSGGSSDLVGDSTDGAGFLDALEGDDGFDPSGRQCLVLGAGGAARAVTLALAGAGAGSVVVIGRRPDAALSCARLAGAVGQAMGPERPGLAEVVCGSDLIVNATRVGMAAGDGLPFEIDPDWLSSRQFVAELIYAPAKTPLLLAARQRSVRAANGLGMLIHQAARQVEIWTGRPAPREAMSAAVLGALAGG